MNKLEYVSSKISQGIEEEKRWLYEIHSEGRAKALIMILGLQIGQSDFIDDLLNDRPVEKVSLWYLKEYFGVCLGPTLYDIYVEISPKRKPSPPVIEEKNIYDCAVNEVIRRLHNKKIGIPNVDYIRDELLRVGEHDFEYDFIDPDRSKPTTMHITTFLRR